MTSAATTTSPTEELPSAIVTASADQASSRTVFFRIRRHEMSSITTGR